MEEWTEVISRLLSLFVTHKLREHWNLSIHFLNFSEPFQYIFTLLVSQLRCHEFRKYSFNHVLKVCRSLFKSQHALLKACKHVTSLRSFCKAFVRLCFFIRFIIGRKIDRKCPYIKRTGSAGANFKVLVTKLDQVESKRTKIKTEINIPPKIYKKQSCRTESIEIGV